MLRPSLPWTSPFPLSFLFMLLVCVVQGAVRAEVLNSGFLMRPRDNGMCEIVYVIQVDLGNMPEVRHMSPAVYARCVCLCGVRASYRPIWATCLRCIMSSAVCLRDMLMFCRLPVLCSFVMFWALRNRQYPFVFCDSPKSTSLLFVL
jgi:hypothetical protein